MKPHSAVSPTVAMYANRYARMKPATTTLPWSAGLASRAAKMNPTKVATKIAPCNRYQPVCLRIVAPLSSEVIA